MKLLLLFVFIPSFTLSQQTHRFENDTLYTSCGYKIYKGQTLQFGKPNEWAGFRYITLKGGISSSSLENNTVVVKDLYKYGKSMTGSPVIDIKASIAYKDGSKGAVVMTLAFDQAIGRLLPGISGELIVPEEFRITREQAQAMHMPVFENDTLYASCGYKIYKDLVLRFGKMTNSGKKFRYVNIRTEIYDRSVENRELKVKELKEFGISVLNNAYITLIGTLLINGKEKEDIEIHMAFDHAIENITGVPGELVVPDEFRGCLKRDPEKEIKRLESLYDDRIISKEELETFKKRLSGN